VPTLQSYVLHRATALFLLTGVLLLALMLWAMSGAGAPPERLVLAGVIGAAVLGAGVVALRKLISIAAKRFTTALTTIVETSDAICSGASTARIPLETTFHGSHGAELPEIRRVYQAVNRLADKQTRDIQEMQRLERVRTEFLANVSHELRTPIFSIQGFLETLLDGAIDDESVRLQFVQKAHSNTLRLDVLLTDLIDISRIESGAMRFSFRYFALLPLAEEILRNLESDAQANAIGLHLDADKLSGGTLTRVYGDRDRIAQVLTNLVSNAIKYNTAGGEVTLRLEDAPAPANAVTELLVRIAVRDTGIGIAPEHHARIFERFYRVDRGRSRAVGGTGLGLAIVKHILEAHKSVVTIESPVRATNGSTNGAANGAAKGTEMSFVLQR
jgi:signal transduction histidine kinase